jgi:hypothetical protein
MDKILIERILNNSIWINPENKIVYKFSNDGVLSIEGGEYFPYSINSSNDYTELQIGAKKRYNIEYVNDFILRLHNSKENFRITPL